MHNYSKNIIYLSQSQYAELIANGSITVNGVTVTYNENDIYVTPQAEPVTDVRVNGTSVAANGIANVPLASSVMPGVMKYSNSSPIVLDGNGSLTLRFGSNDQIKEGATVVMPFSIAQQHAATFYGLAKASGDTTQSQSSNTVGTYTDEAKQSIQQMLGVSSLLAPSEPTLVASKAYVVGDVFTANGKLYKVTSAIAATETIVVQDEGETVSGHNAEETSLSDGFVKFTNYATINTAGVVKVQSDRGLTMDSTGRLQVGMASDIKLKNGTDTFNPVVSANEHTATFYGLAKAAGDTTQSQSSNAVGTYTDDAKAAIRTMVGAVGNEDYATTSSYGVVKPGNGLLVNSSNVLSIATATETQCKLQNGSTGYQPITVFNQHAATFYGLAKASGDTTQSASSNAVGTYTDNAKASIKSMLGIVDGSTGTVSVTGATPTITAVENTRYVCGEVATLNIMPPASGICIIRFTSGTTATVLTATGVVWPEWFDATALETERVYEICITDGYGMVVSWAQ